MADDASFDWASVVCVFGVSGRHYRPCLFIRRRITSFGCVQSVEKCHFKAQSLGSVTYCLEYIVNRGNGNGPSKIIQN